MGRTRRRQRGDNASSKSLTLPSSPSHSFSSSSSSDFEFTISISPQKSSSNLCPADELFYKGQLLPLHLSPRISMVRTLLLSSSSNSSSSDTTTTTTTTASRDSTGSSNDSRSSFSSDLGLLAECDSSRPSSVTEEDELKRLNQIGYQSQQSKKSNKYFSLARFSSVFRKNRDQENVPVPAPAPESSVRRMSSSAKDVFRKYVKKVKPLYEKLSQKQKTIITEESVGKDRETAPVSHTRKDNNGVGNSISHYSFSGNLSLRYPRRRSCISSCPSSMRSSPNHSGSFCRSDVIKGMNYSDSSSSMDDLQNAIQGAITHCKNSMSQNKTFVSKEI